MRITEWSSDVCSSDRNREKTEMDHSDYRAGVLYAEDVPLPELADAVGNPFYCYSTATIERQFRVFSEALAGVGGEPPLLAYVVQANPNKSVSATLAVFDAGADLGAYGGLRGGWGGGVRGDHSVFRIVG